MDRHYIESVAATTHQEKGIMTLESNPSRGTALPAPHETIRIILDTEIRQKYHVQEPPGTAYSHLVTGLQQYGTPYQMKPEIYLISTNLKIL